MCIKYAAQGYDSTLNSAATHYQLIYTRCNIPVLMMYHAGDFGWKLHQNIVLLVIEKPFNFSCLNYGVLKYRGSFNSITVWFQQFCALKNNKVKYYILQSGQIRYVRNLKVDSKIKSQHPNYYVQNLMYYLPAIENAVPILFFIVGVFSPGDMNSVYSWGNSPVISDSFRHRAFSSFILSCRTLSSLDFLSSSPL